MEGGRQLHGHRHLLVPVPCSELAIPATADTSTIAARASAIIVADRQRATSSGTGVQTFETEMALVEVEVEVWFKTPERAHVSIQARTFRAVLSKGSTGCPCHHLDTSSRRLTLRQQFPGVHANQPTRFPSRDSRCHPRNNGPLSVTRLSATPFETTGRNPPSRLPSHPSASMYEQRADILDQPSRTRISGRFPTTQLQLHVSSLVHTVDVAKSGSNGELLRDRRQFLQHLSTSLELLLADAAVVNAVLHTNRNAKLVVASRLA